VPIGGYPHNGAGSCWRGHFNFDSNSSTLNFVFLGMRRTLEQRPRGALWPAVGGASENLFPACLQSPDPARNGITEARVGPLTDRNELKAGNWLSCASGLFNTRGLRGKGLLFLIWTPPVLQDTVSFVTRKRLLPYIRPVEADVPPLALMNSARLALNILSASKAPSNKPGFQDDGLTCLVINLYCVLATC
jgi:hypothetical protein